MEIIIMLLLLLHLAKPSAVFVLKRAQLEVHGGRRERQSVLATAVSSEALESVLSFSSSLWGLSFSEEDEQDTVLIITLARDI
jgi:hypothetical protein